MKFIGVPISEIKAGENINGIYILKNRELRTGANKKLYLDLSFADSTGEISGKDWNIGADFDLLNLPLHKLYYVNARVDTWREVTQLNVNRIKLAEEKDQAEIRYFVPSAPIEPEEMLLEIYDYADSIVNSEIKSIVLTIIKDREKKLIYYPAAKSLHHSIRSGLLYHMLRMLRSAKALISVYDKINADLLYAGVLLHDLAKVDELEASELGIAEYGKEGKLLGHIIIGVTEIDRVGRIAGGSDEVILVLKHMVLSHHDKAEFGSPKPPMFIEAEMLHHLDMIDARVYDYENALKNVKPGSFSESVWSLDKRVLYSPALNGENNTVDKSEISLDVIE